MAQIHFAVEEHIAWLTLDSPGKLNALSVGMWLEIRRLIESQADNRELRCIVLRGAGGNFAAGADIDEFDEVRRDEVTGRRYHLEVIGPTLEALRTAPQPIIAALEGVCVGGGLEIACACDLRLAADNLRLGVPVGRIGFPLALPELKPMLQLVGPAVAADLLLSGRLYDAQEALIKGLVNRVVPAADFEQHLAALVRSVAAGSPMAARLNKANIRMMLERGGQYTARDLDESFSFLSSDDYREGIAAFIAKRPPHFTGR